MVTKENYFTELSKIGVELNKKGKLNYSSWSDIWSEIKKNIPDIKYEWLENKDGTLGFVDNYGCYAKVRVYSEILGVDVTQHLQVQDFKNQSVKKDKLDSNMINKTYQRCLVKAIATGFGLGLYVFQGEDLPETDWVYEFTNAKNLGDLGSLWLKSPKTKDLLILKDKLKLNFNKDV